jgi:acyl-CoA reductase-like NAD-dependent aldehyde dehydrogenase
VPENLEQEHLYRAKLAEAQRALELAIISVEEKQHELDALRQGQRRQQQEEAFQELKVRAEEFNRLIDSAMGRLQEMRELALVAGSGRFEIVADMNEMPYCSVNQSSVKLRRRFDVLRG